ncbi:AMP-binding protein [Camelimonas abortus]|uniref:AMP-binding protein n=1 Tax=Camelimonas abortus TaxID=1017184 RepID=A0ABV7LF74_9HYPH
MNATSEDRAPAYLASEEAYLAHVRKLWDARWPQGVPRTQRYPLGERTLSDYLREWARRTPDRPAIIFYDRVITWAELDRLSDRCAAMLARAGVRKGDTVAVFLPNCPQFIIAFHAILKLGAIHVPVNPMFREQELAYELNDTGARVLIAQDELLPLVAAVRGETAVEHVYATSPGEFLPERPFGPLPAGLDAPRQPLPEGVTDFVSAMMAETGAPPETEVSLDDVAALNYTGGTTGMPKGCVHTQRDMLFTGASICSITCSIGPDDVFINFWPVFWVAGEDWAILGPIVSGAACVLMARWDAKAWLAQTARYRVTVAAMVVDNAVEIMERPDAASHDLSSLRETLVASFVKKLNVSFRDRWRALTGGVVLREAAWGMTETNSFDTFTRGFQEGNFDLNARQVFCGLPTGATDFKIMEFGGRKLVPLGQEGELCVRSPSLLKGYWKRPDATAEGLVDGWLRTGDIGMITEEGFILFLGRRKEMLKVKGMSVFPAEIEAVLGQHPSVTGSGVIGREDPEKGQVPVAFVMVKDDTSADDLLAFCRQRLAVYKIPELRVVDSLPMTATGKVKKEELAAMFNVT